VTIKDELASELRDAIRSGDKRRSNAIRQVETEVSVARSAPGFSGEIDDELYTSVIGAYVKKMGKAQAEFEAAGARGADHAAKLAFEVEYLSRWLPQVAGEDETRAVVKAAIVELGADDPKMAGRVTGHIMRSESDLDGGLVNRIVREELGT
jgi:hypothetical protein